MKILSVIYVTCHGLENQNILLLVEYDEIF